MGRLAKPARQAATAQSVVPALPPSLPTAPASAPSPLLSISPLGISSVPRWKRAHDSKMRKKVARILVLKMAGHKTSAIAKRLATTPETIRHYLYIAGKNGWLSPDGLELVDPAETLVYESAHKVVRNINSALDGKALGGQQFEMTVETAKGIGLFKQHSASKVEGAITMPALEVKFVLPQGGAPFVAPEGAAYGGNPAYAEGQVVGPKELESGKENGHDISNA